MLQGLPAIRNSEKEFMKEIYSKILSRALVLGAGYADVRTVRTRRQLVSVVNGEISKVDDGESEGYNIRVWMGGFWGFAACCGRPEESWENTLQSAVDVARAAGRLEETGELFVPEAGVAAVYRTPCEIDPFSVPVSDKIEFLKMCDREIGRLEDIRQVRLQTEAVKENKLFVSTEGSCIEQELTTSGGGVLCTAERHGEVQSRSYPNRFGRERSCAGWEYVLRMNLANEGKRVSREACMLLHAKECPKKKTTVILDGSQTALALHETCGHAVELDRIFGEEMAYAGGSYLAGEERGKYRFGSEIVNVVADATCPGGLGTYGYDDEGVKAQRIELVKNGIWTGVIADRADSLKLGIRAGGMSRSESWSSIPMARMTNINLEPGEWSLEDLIGNTGEGIYMEVCRSLSVDRLRLNYRFGAEVAWEIKEGKLGDVLKNPAITGTGRDLWRSCDAICGRKYWRMWGTDCGKGQPSQNVVVGHGTSPARFRNVQAGTY